jgi:hypothetical protein
MTAEEITTARLRVFENGYLPTAVDGKDAVEVGWRDPANITPETIMASVQRHPRASNTGGNTMYMPAFDTDIRHPEAARAAQDYLRERFGDRGTWVRRVGMPPKCADLFQTAVPFKKITRQMVAPGEDPDAGGYKPHGIEVLCDGQQVVLFGIHPDTQKPYTYPLGATPLNTLRTELPEITEAEAIEATDDIVALLIRDFDFVPYEKPAANGHAGNGTSAGPVDPEAELGEIAPGRVNNIQCRVIASMLRRGEHPDDVLERVVGATMDKAPPDWTREVEVSCVTRRIISIYHNMLIPDCDLVSAVPPSWLPGEFHAEWGRITGAGHRPRFGKNHHGFFLRSWGPKAGDFGSGSAENGSTAGTQSPGEAPKAAKRSRTVMQPFKGFDWTTFPARQWLYGNHYQRKTASATVAPGGTGKTTLGMVDAIALATCRNLLGEQPTERCRVWLHNGEDPIEEMDRRIGAICYHYGIPMAELEGWLFRSSGAEVPLRVANGFSDLKLDAPLIALIKDEIRANQVDVVILDPLVTLHSTAESDNGKMDQVMRVFTGIATEMDCAIDVSHHTRKLAPGVLAHTAEDSRGAVAIRDAVRAMRVLNIMSAVEAANLGIPEAERQSYVRVDRGKGNSLPPAKVATWRRFENVAVPNGDRVGVLTAWERPLEEGAATKEAAETVFLLLLDQYTLSGRTVSAAKNAASYAPRVFASEEEAVAAKCGLRPLEGAMKRLFKNGCIRAGDKGHSGAIVRADRTAPDTDA